jgi:DNA-directed RNA polymerase specialized sigma24 family protein
VANRAACRACASGRASPRPVDGAGVSLWTPELPHPERDPELDAALRALPARQRLVVFLRYFADLSHAEIATFSGLQLGTVSATLAQAKRTLARRLDVNHRATEEVQ